MIWLTYSSIEIIYFRGEAITLYVAKSINKKARDLPDEFITCKTAYQMWNSLDFSIGFAPFHIKVCRASRYN